jgi:hypothetical protein
MAVALCPASRHCEYGGQEQNRSWYGPGYFDAEPLVKCLLTWAANFLKREPEEYVFPYERYGAAGDDFLPCVYDTDPREPIGSWKEAWEKARAGAKVWCRFVADSFIGLHLAFPLHC